MIAACTRESKCTTSRIHQHIEKNSVPLKEVLTRQCRRIRHAPRDNIAARIKQMRIVREIAASAIVTIAGNPCAAGVSCTRIIDASHSHHASASRRDRSEARCADSESQFLAIKKFSGFPHRGRIGPRQNRFFERIANTDSRADFSATRRRYDAMRNDPAGGASVRDRVCARVGH